MNIRKHLISVCVYVEYVEHRTNVCSISHGILRLGREIWSTNPVLGCVCISHHHHKNSCLNNSIDTNNRSSSLCFGTSLTSQLFLILDQNLPFCNLNLFILGFPFGEIQNKFYSFPMKVLPKPKFRKTLCHDV